MKKEIIVKEFDGETMTVIVGDKFTVNELVARNLVADITARTAAAEAKAAIVEEMTVKIAELSDELAETAPALAEDTEEAKTLILYFVNTYRANGLIVPPELLKFIEDIDPVGIDGEPAPVPADNVPTEDAAPVEFSTPAPPGPDAPVVPSATPPEQEDE